MITFASLPTILPDNSGSPTLPAGYDSVVPDYAYRVEGVDGGDTGHHYDYQTQRWELGHDHAHVDEACALPPLFCGADWRTCQQTAHPAPRTIEL